MTVRKSAEVRALEERIGFLEAQIERMQEAEHALHAQLASRLPTSVLHEMLDQRSAPREDNGRRLVLSERLDWLGRKKE